MTLPDFKTFTDFDGVSYGFFGRTGGVSEGLYASLNCGRGSGDNPDHVVENLARVAGALGARPENLLTMYQIHSAICLQVDEALGDRPECDALVTDKPGLALCVLTADCAPVLFYGRKEDGSPVIGAAHAGWKGAIGGVLQSTLSGMLKLGAQRESIKAIVGPCITKDSYEVSVDFSAPFLELDAGNEIFFSSGAKEGHLMFDLPGFVTKELAHAGVQNVHLTDIDTYKNEMDYFSYRRKTHRGEEDYGRQISAIMIKCAD